MRYIPVDWAHKTHSKREEIAAEIARAENRVMWFKITHPRGKITPIQILVVNIWGTTLFVALTIDSNGVTLGQCSPTTIQHDLDIDGPDAALALHEILTLNQDTRSRSLKVSGADVQAPRSEKFSQDFQKLMEIVPKAKK
jgi:hypothetical protein